MMSGDSRRESGLAGLGRAPRTSEGTSSVLGAAPMRAVHQRLERILIDDRELLISLQCQLDQIRRELRLLNDDRIVRALTDDDPPISH
jgi:hypothetical protein